VLYACVYVGSVCVSKSMSIDFAMVERELRHIDVCVCVCVCIHGWCMNVYMGGV
jgi:hypothetical protein